MAITRSAWPLRSRAAISLESTAVGFQARRFWAPVAPAQLLAEETQNESRRNDFNASARWAVRTRTAIPGTVLTAGHKLVTGAFGKAMADAQDSSELFDCVIVGGWNQRTRCALFSRATATEVTTLVLENHSIFGGEAKQNNLTWTAAPWAIIGSAIYSRNIRAVFLRSFTIDWP